MYAVKWYAWVRHFVYFDPPTLLWPTVCPTLWFDLKFSSVFLAKLYFDQNCSSTCTSRPMRSSDLQKGRSTERWNWCAPKKTHEYSNLLFFSKKIVVYKTRRLHRWGWSFWFSIFFIFVKFNRNLRMKLNRLKASNLNYFLLQFSFYKIKNTSCSLKLKCSSNVEVFYSKLVSQIKILGTNGYFRPQFETLVKIDILVKNKNFGQKSTFWPKIKISVKNQHFGQK